MTTRADIVQMVKANLGFRNDLDALILSTLRYVQESVLEGDVFLPWFLQDNDIVMELPEGKYIGYLPEDFLRELDYNTTRAYATATPDCVFSLRKLTQDPLDAHVQPARRPETYSLFGCSFSFNCPADQDYVVFLAGYRREAVLDEDESSNAWTKNASDWLIAETTRRIAISLRDKLAWEQAAAERTLARNRLMMQTAAREAAATDLSGRALRAGRER